MTLMRGRSQPDGRNGHVVDYRHVIHSLRRKPMALLNLVYRHQLFPRDAYRQAFEHMLEQASPRDACRIMVELLAIADERACEAELASLLAADLAAGRPPDLNAIRQRFAPDPASLPAITIPAMPLTSYDILLHGAAA